MTAFVAEPALVQLVVTTIAAALIWLLLLRWRRIAEEVRQRAALEPFLLGVELAMTGDVQGALPRLRRVLEEDPQNQHARLLLAELLASRGEHEAAHQHHVLLLRSAGYATGRNDLALARTLLALKRPADAVAAAERAVRTDESEAALLTLFETRLAAGLPQDAAETGERLLRSMVASPARERITDATARALLTAVDVRVRAGRSESCAAWIGRASTLVGERADVRLARHRLATIERGVESVRADLQAIAAIETVSVVQVTATSQQTSVSVVTSSTQSTEVAASAAARPATTAPAQPTPPSSLSHLLSPTAPYRCPVCGAPSARPMAQCVVCRMPVPAALVEPTLYEEVTIGSEWMDEIEATPSHARRLVRRACEGHPEAEDDLVELGELAVEEVLAGVVQFRTEAAVLVRVLRRMGPAILPRLFDVHVRWKERGLVRLFGRFSDDVRGDVIGQVVQGFGREALGYMEPLWTTQDRDLRRLVVDFVIGLADQDEFARVLEQFPPVEVIQRANETPAEPLVGLLQGALDGGMLVEAVLVQPTFRRDAEVLRAAALAADPSVLEAVLVRRGPGEALVPLLIERLGDEREGPIAERVLASFGSVVAVHLVHAYVSPDAKPGIRERARRRIVALGAAAVHDLVGAFGSRPSLVDDDLVEVLTDCGHGSLPALVEAFEPPGGLVGRIYDRVVSRYTHRRVMVLRAIARIGGPASLAIVEDLRTRETDANLKLRLEQTRKRIADAIAAGDETTPNTGGEHGQVG